jgi:fumarate reductase flavoprotein subunit
MHRRLGRVFPFTTNANIKTGDGMALAYRAGAPLKDMEFVQYHPTGLPFTGILITEAARAEGGWLINKDGYRYLQDYDLGKPEPEPVLRSMELGPRDRLSQAFVHEMEKGRVVDTPDGPVVHLDLRHLGERVINTKLPFVRELCLEYQNIDPVTALIPVRPVVHYMMGGVHTDINGATPIGRLYAAGEVACVSINGANRLGSNSLPECLVFGAAPGGRRRVRRSRARSRGFGAGAGCRRAAPARARPAPQVRRSRAHLDLREQMQQVMEQSAGIYRAADTLAKGADTLTSAGAVRLGADRGSQPDVQHGAARRARAVQHAGCGRRHHRLLSAARGVARRPPAHRLPDPRRRSVPGPFADLPRAGRRESVGVPAGHDDPLAAGERIYGR